MPLATTVLVDSYFWSELVWPELSGILFNVYEGKSAEWGVSIVSKRFECVLGKILMPSDRSLPCILILVFISQKCYLGRQYLHLWALLSIRAQEVYSFLPSCSWDFCRFLGTRNGVSSYTPCLFLISLPLEVQAGCEYTCAYNEYASNYLSLYLSLKSGPQELDENRSYLSKRRALWAVAIADRGNILFYIYLASKLPRRRGVDTGSYSRE